MPEILTSKSVVLLIIIFVQGYLSLYSSVATLLSFIKLVVMAFISTVLSFG